MVRSVGCANHSGCSLYLSAIPLTVAGLVVALLRDPEVVVDADAGELDRLG